MEPSEQLARAKPCRRCGIEIPSGTPLSALDWDRRERAWAHRAPTCDEVQATASKGAPSLPPAEGPAASPNFPARTRTVDLADQPSPDDPARGSWSVTIEIHEGEDPAQSKRVLRIARLHIGTYAEAGEVARQLQKEWYC